MTTKPHNTHLSILGTSIRQDAEGRYCLNDCHRAAGGDNAKRPSLWAENAQTKALIVELEGSAGNPAHPFNVVTAGPNEGRGTYGSEEVLLAYAQWISPAFHVQCLRALLAMMKGEFPATPSVSVADIESTARSVMGGIMKSGLGKLHREMMAELKAELAPTLDEMRGLIVTHHVGAVAVDAKTAKEWLEEYGCEQKGRNSPVRTVSHDLRDIALREGIVLSKCPWRKAWLFPTSMARPYMEQTGRQIVRIHNEAVKNGQTALALRDMPKSASNVIPFPSTSQEEEASPLNRAYMIDTMNNAPTLYRGDMVIWQEVSGFCGEGFYLIGNSANEGLALHRVQSCGGRLRLLLDGEMWKNVASQEVTPEAFTSVCRGRVVARVNFEERDAFFGRKILCDRKSA